MAHSHKIFHINSYNRVTGDANDFEHEVDLIDHDVDRVCVLQCNIPKSYYQMRSGYNAFTLTELGVDYTVTLTPGNYSRSNLKTALATLMTAASGNGWTYSVTFPSSASVDTGKYTFTVTGNSSNQPSLTFGASSADNTHDFLGFDPSSTNAFTADSIISTNVISLTVEDIIYVHSDLAAGSTDTLLQEIYGYGPDFDNINFTSPDTHKYSKPLSPHLNDHYRFYLTNERDERINLNGRDWSMAICCYKHQDNVDDTRSMLRQLLVAITNLS